jgi:hypothetical protein
MPEEALDSSADDSDGDVSLTRSVPGQFDEPDLMLDSFSRLYVVMGLQVYVVTNGRIAGLNRKVSWENVNLQRKHDA